MAGPSAELAQASVTFACGQCGAALAFAGVRTETCPYCASPNFVERPPSAGQPEPRFVVAFTGDAAAARAKLDLWLGSRTWFADARIKRARIEDLRGVYVPAYLYSAVAQTDYTATIGEQYTETETYEVDDDDDDDVKERLRSRLPIGRRTGARAGRATKQKRTATRIVTRTEFRPLSGRHVGYITDVIVSASHGLSHHELNRIEPFDLRQLRRFAPALISGWIAEEFSRDADECRRTSRGEALEEVGERLRRFMPGDSYCDLAWSTQVQWESLEPCYVPVWVLAVRWRDDKPPLRVVINGQTGAIAGKVPLSWWKIGLAVFVLAAIAGGIVWLARDHKPPPVIMEAMR